jgi:two-component system cell cycle sensor histidine kinase/response regulator CckA
MAATPGEMPAVPEGLIKFVTEAGRDLKRAENLESLLISAAQMPVPVLADLCVLALAEARHPPQLVVGHADPARAAAIHQRLESHGDALGRAAHRFIRRWGARQPRWLPSLNARVLEKFFGDDPAVLRVLRELDVEGLIISPLSVRGRTLGALVLARTAHRPPFGAADLAAGQVLSRRVALAIDDARAARPSAPTISIPGRLEEAIRKWSHVFEHAGWGAAILDGDDSRIEAVNAAFATMHGFNHPEELVGLPFAELVTPECRAGLSERLIPGRLEPQTYEMAHLRHPGGTFPALVNLTAIGGAGDAPLYRAVNVQDLTELRRVEERLHRAQRMESVGRLAGGVAHEVNNMMTIVLGYADLVERAPGLTPEIKEDVAQICTAAGRAARVTQQLLAYSRQQLLHPTVLDLNEVVRTVVDSLRSLLPSDIEVETSLQSITGGVRVDRAQLEQVIINLSFNARDAMPNGGRLRLATDYRELDAEFGRRSFGVAVPPGPYALLLVSDTGVGMDQHTQSHLFEPFFTTKPSGQGTGLGLSTVYGIVKQSSGFIWADSTRGEGSTLAVCFPVVPIGFEADLDESADEERRRGDETVLLVEDELAVRKLARRALEAEGYRVLEAHDGEEAIAIADGWAERIDLVLTDVVMPRMGGRELRDRLAAARPEVPVLYMSAYASEDVVGRGLLHAADPFIQKPFTAASLAARVRGLLDAVRAETE